MLYVKSMATCHFYSILNIVGINVQVISQETKMIRRKFLNDLEFTLCQEYMEYRAKIPTLSREIAQKINQYADIDTMANIPIIATSARETFRPF